MKSKRLFVFTLPVLLVLSGFSVIVNPKTTVREININDIELYPDIQIELYVDAGWPYYSDTFTVTLRGYAKILNATINATIISYAWNFGDGTSERIQLSSPSTEISCTITHTYPHGGYFNALLSVVASIRGTKFLNIETDTTLVCINKPIPPEPSEYPRWYRYPYGITTSRELDDFDKKVWSPVSEEWGDYAGFLVGEPIKFKITWEPPDEPFGWPLVYPDSYYADIKIIDMLPPTVKFINASREPTKIEKKVYFDYDNMMFVPFTVLEWDLGKHHVSHRVGKPIIINCVVEYLNYSYFDIPEKYWGIPINYLTTNYAREEARSKYGSGCPPPYDQHLVTHVAIATDIVEFSVRESPECGGIKITKTVNKSLVYIGDEIKYTIFVENTGNIKLYDIYVNDTMFGFSEYIDSLEPAEIVTLHFNYTISPDDPPIIKNIATVEVYDGNHTRYSDWDKAEVKVIRGGINVTKCSDKTSAHVGEIINYTINVTNTGNVNLSNVTVYDITLDFYREIGNLGPGEYYKFYIEHQISSTDPDPFVNKVVARGYDELGKIYTDNDTAVVDIICESNFSLQKLVKWDCQGPYVKDLTITQDQWNQAKWVTFRIYVNNTGDTPLDIYVRDDLPEGLIYREGTSTPKEPEKLGKSLYWNFTDVQPNDKITIEFVADVTECGNFTNIVHVTARYDCNEIEKEDYAIVRTPPCTCIPGMKIDKKVWNKETGEWVDSISIDESPKELRFNITLENNGTCDIFNLTINDKLGCVLHNLRDFYESDKDLIRKLVDETHGFVSWKLNRTLHPGEKIYMEFNATAYLQQGGSTYNRVDAVGDTSKVHLKADDTVNIYYPIEEPKLAFYPTSIEITDPIYIGDPISKTFEIWNDGTGTLVFNITGYPSYVTVTPKDGTSADSSDKKTITVEISTSSLGEGEHSVAIPIQSNDGNGIFYVNFTLINPPQLSYTPLNIYLYDVEKGTIFDKTIEIWNEGDGTLTYTLAANCEWIILDPEEGESTGEKDTINVTIDTSSLDVGIHECNITINSNGGSGIVRVHVEVIPPAQPPNVSIEKPIDGAIYLWNKEIFRFFRTIIIGPIAIEVNATDPDGNIEKVEFFIDNTSVYNDTEAPYAYAFNDRMFGRHTIKVVAYDDQGLSSEASVEAFIISFGIRTVEIE